MLEAYVTTVQNLVSQNLSRRTRSESSQAGRHRHSLVNDPNGLTVETYDLCDRRPRWNTMVFLPGNPVTNQIPCLVPAWKWRCLPKNGRPYSPRTVLFHKRFARRMAVFRPSPKSGCGIHPCCEYAQLAEFFFVQYVANTSRQPA